MGSKTYQSVSAGVFLIGLGVLFLAHISIWPWILVVIGLATLPASLAAKKGWFGWQGTLWLVGLAILFATGQIFPGILILVGISALGSALTRDADGSPFAAQRSAVLPAPEAPQNDTHPLTPPAEGLPEQDNQPTPPSAV